MKQHSVLAGLACLVAAAVGATDGASANLISVDPVVQTYWAASRDASGAFSGFHSHEAGFGVPGKYPSPPMEVGGFDQRAGGEEMRGVAEFAMPFLGGRVVSAKLAVRLGNEGLAEGRDRPGTTTYANTIGIDVYNGNGTAETGDYDRAGLASAGPMVITSGYTSAAGYTVRSNPFQPQFTHGDLFEVDVTDALKSISNSSIQFVGFRFDSLTDYGEDHLGHVLYDAKLTFQVPQPASAAMYGAGLASLVILLAAGRRRRLRAAP